MSPKKAPMLQKMTECHSTLTFMKMMQNPAVTIPILCKQIMLHFCIKYYLDFNFLFIIIQLWSCHFTENEREWKKIPEGNKQTADCFKED